MVDLVTIAIGFVQLIFGLIFAAVAIYIGVRVFDRFTKGIDEMKELKAGNTAIGVLLAAIVITVAIIVQSGISGLTGAVVGGTGRTAMDYIIGIAGGLVQLIIGVILAVVAIFLALNIFDRIFKSIPLHDALKAGNVGVAVVAAGFLIAVGFVIQAGVGAIAAGFA